MPVVPNYNVGGDNATKRFVSNKNIRFLIRRQLAEQRVARDATHKHCRGLNPNLLAHAFWTNASTGPGATIRHQGSLTHVSAVGLHTALETGFTVNLWTFHEAFDMDPSLRWHPRLQLRDAKEHVPLEKFMDMLRAKWPWGNIADVIRFRAAFAGSGDGGAWVLDLDTFWLRRPTAANSPSATGHIIATCAARHRQFRDAEHWKVMYLSKPGVRTSALPPMYFPRRSQILKDLMDKLWDTGAPPRLYTHWLREIEKLMVESGFGGDFQPPMRYHPCHIWVPLSTLIDPQKEQKQLDTYQYGWPYHTAEEVVQETVAFNNPFQTSAPGKSKEHRIAPMTFAADSWFHKVFNHLHLAPAVLGRHLSPATFEVLVPRRRRSGKRKAEVDTVAEAAAVDASRPAFPSSSAAQCPPRGGAGPRSGPVAAQQMVDCFIAHRNSASMGVFWESLGAEAREFLLAETASRGLRRGAFMH